MCSAPLLTVLAAERCRVSSESENKLTPQPLMQHFQLLHAARQPRCAAAAGMRSIAWLHGPILVEWFSCRGMFRQSNQDVLPAERQSRAASLTDGSHFPEIAGRRDAAVRPMLDSVRLEASRSVLAGAQSNSDGAAAQTRCCMAGHHTADACLPAQPATGNIALRGMLIQQCPPLLSCASRRAGVLHLPAPPTPALWPARALAVQAARDAQLHRTGSRAVEEGPALCKGGKGLPGVARLEKCSISQHASGSCASPEQAVEGPPSL